MWSASSSLVELMGTLLASLVSTASTFLLQGYLTISLGRLMRFFGEHIALVVYHPEVPNDPL